MTYFKFNLPEPLVAALIGLGAMIWALLGDEKVPPWQTIVRKAVAGVSGALVGWYVVPSDWQTWSKYLACAVLSVFGDKVRPMAVKWGRDKLSK